MDERLKFAFGLRILQLGRDKYPLQRDSVCLRFKYVNWTRPECEHVCGYFIFWEFLLAVTLYWLGIVEPEIADASEDREELLVTDGAFRLMSSHPSMVMARRCWALAMDLVTTCNSFGWPE